MKKNYRGIRPASIVIVLEGEGTIDSPYNEVEYVIVMEEIHGIIRPVTIGTVTPLTEPIKYRKIHP